jgi:hypothetical protein
MPIVLCHDILYLGRLCSEQPAYEDLVLKLSASGLLILVRRHHQFGVKAFPRIYRASQAVSHQYNTLRTPDDVILGDEWMQKYVATWGAGIEPCECLALSAKCAIDCACKGVDKKRRAVALHRCKLMVCTKAQYIRLMKLCMVTVVGLDNAVNTASQPADLPVLFRNECCGIRLGDWSIMI